MAENWLQRLNPITRIRNIGQNFREHPVQATISTLLGLGGGALAGPAGAQAANRGSQWLFRQYNQSQAPDGLPGIIGPNTYDPANQTQTMAGLLGIPNYATGNSGFTNANQFLTGNFGPQQQQTGSGFQPIDLSYGQSQQQAPDASQAPLPGLGSPMGSYGASSGPRTGGQSSGYSGDTASGARGTVGMGVGQASMSDIENMLSGGMRGRGERQLFPNREIGELRAEAKAQGKTLAQLLGVYNQQ